MGTKSERTKERILKEAWSLFAQKGFQAVTMTDICEKTGLSRGGVYRYFTGTDQIFGEILSQEYPLDDRIDRQESAAVILEDMLCAIKKEILEMYLLYIEDFLLKNNNVKWQFFSSNLF